MPRHKRAFIERSRATTYQLVHAPTADNPQHQLFVPSDQLPGANNPSTSTSGKDTETAGPSQPRADFPGLDADDLQSSYKTTDFELGEYGFPDDGYDYSKHFRTIGGGGGVFMDALTGLPDPDAVRSKSSVQKSERTPQPRDAPVALREGAQSSNGRKDTDSSATIVEDDIDENDTNTNTQADHSIPSWRDPRDELQRMAALDELHRDQKRNKDLAAVVAALDSDAEADEETLSNLLGEDLLTEPEKLIKLSEEASLVDPLSDGVELEDDFVQRAAYSSDEEHPNAEGYSKRGSDSNTGKLDGIVETFREPRALDAQFERFMQGFELDVSTDDEVAEYRSTMESMVNDDDEEATANDIRALLTQDEIAAMGGGFDDADIVSGLADMSLFNDDQPDDGNEDGVTEERDLVSTNEVGGHDAAREAETERYVAAEFDDGMARLLQSYERVHADTAFAAHDGLEGARAAAQRQMADDAARAARKAAKGNADGESDVDSELEEHFGDLYDDDNEEKWDCETIISTYTNLDNHPSVIDDAPPRRRRPQRDTASSVIRLDPRTQAPIEGIGPVESQAEGQTSRHDIDYGSRRPTAAAGGAARDKAESKEDKKARKAAIKEAARERRALKSEMKKAFGAEHVKQGRHAATLGKSKVAMQF